MGAVLGEAQTLYLIKEVILFLKFQYIRANSLALFFFLSLPGIERIELRQKICNTWQHPETNFICLSCYIEEDP